LIRLPLMPGRMDILIQLMRWRMSGAYWGNQELHTMWEELLMNGFDVWFHVGEREDGARLLFFEATQKVCMQVPIERHTGNAHVGAESHLPNRAMEILQRHGYCPIDAS